MLRVADEMAARSLSFDAALQEMASLFTRLQVAQIAPQAIADDLPERERLLDMASSLDPEFVQLAYQIAVHGRHELPLAPDEYAGFIMTLLRLYAFRPDAGDDAEARVPPATATRRATRCPICQAGRHDACGDAVQRPRTSSACRRRSSRPQPTGSAADRLATGILAASQDQAAWRASWRSTAS